MASPTEDANPLIISLNQIMTDYDGQLSLARKAYHTDDVLIHWSVEVDVADKGQQTFFVMMAVCWSDMDSEDAYDLLVQQARETLPEIFCFIPARDYGTDAYGAFIADNKHGDIFTKGVSNEMVTQANVEKAVIEAGSRA